MHERTDREFAGSAAGGAYRAARAGTRVCPLDRSLARRCGMRRNIRAPFIEYIVGAAVAAARRAG